MQQIERPIVFIDTVCPRPYDPHTLATEGLGGTEATVVRIAEGLGEKETVWVSQHKRTHTTMSKAIYKPLKTEMLQKTFKCKAFIILRNPTVAINIKKMHPDTPVFLWLHDIVNNDIIPYINDLSTLHIGVVVVSDYHKGNFIDHARRATWVSKWPKIARIYNPIDDSLMPDNTPIDPTKLVFFSSPHKGLGYTLEAFKGLTSVAPNMKLYVANPGYLEIKTPLPMGVTNLGVLSHKEAINHVRSSLCVFYPNFVFPETFGLVFAEANAVGTPVLTHYLGAAREVLGTAEQVMDVREMPSLVEKVLSWQKERPTVEGQTAFRLTNVLKSWNTMLGLR